jgi:large subunit ribosomal protein L6
MSRIGLTPVAIPAKVKVAIAGTTVSVEGPKGKLAYTFPKSVKITQADNTVNVENTLHDDRQANAIHGTTRALIHNMVVGVVDGYTKNITIKGVGFRAVLKGKELVLNLGYSHPINFTVPDTIKITVAEDANKNPTLKIEGPDKQLVGAVAAELKSYYKPEPYKGKGVHIEGETYRRKEGKKAG